MIVAAVQMEGRGLDVEANAARARAAVGDAAARGATLVVLPELISTGYVLERDAIARLAETASGDGPTLSAWRSAAREHGTAVIGGYAERDGDTLYNAVAVIDRHGDLVGGYRKLHLFGAEPGVFARGNLGLPTFTLDGVNVGVLVCYDLRFPETIRLQALAGAHLIAVPTAWVRGFDAPLERGERIEQVEGVLTQANLNQVYVACADQAGAAGEVRFLGRSLIASPYGAAIAGPLPADGEGVALAEVDTGEAARAQVRGEGISPRADRRTDVYRLEPVVRGVPDAAGSRDDSERGALVDVRRALATGDPELLALYESLRAGAATPERSLDPRTSALAQVGVSMALDAPAGDLVAHMRAAVAHGASERDVLEVLEQAAAQCGIARFRAGVAAYWLAFGSTETEA